MIYHSLSVGSISLVTIETRPAFFFFLIDTLKIFSQIFSCWFFTITIDNIMHANISMFIIAIICDYIFYEFFFIPCILVYSYMYLIQLLSKEALYLLKISNLLVHLTLLRFLLACTVLISVVSFNFEEETRIASLKVME